MEQLNKPKAIDLKAVPPDIYDALIGMQSQVKKEKVTGQYSLEKTVYLALRKYFQLKPLPHES